MEIHRLSGTAPTLHFFCGKAGAGKTTVASRLAQDHGAILISEDIWLMRLFGDQMKTFDDYKIIDHPDFLYNGLDLKSQLNIDNGFRDFNQKPAARNGIGASF